MISELAFLLMDLLHRGLRREANAVFNRYLYRTGDIGDLSILPLFLALRSGIRAHTSAMAAENAPDESEGAQASENARAYLGLGMSLLEEDAPILMAIGGLSGTGKSTVAREIAPFMGRPPGALVLGTDTIRKQLWGVEPLVRLPPEAYRREMDEAVYDALAERGARALRAGQAVILDGTFRDPARRRQAEQMAQSAGVAFDGVWLDADADSLTRRVSSRTGDASDATVPVLEEQLAAPPEKIEWRRVESGRAVADVSRDVGRALGLSGG